MLTVSGDLYLVTEPEMKYNDKGMAITSFRARSPEGKEDVTWVKATIFGKSAEVANQYLVKGKGISFNGRIRTKNGNIDAYINKEGQPTATLEVYIDRWSFLSGGNPTGSAE
jgi:single-stranded DNA-binding protein